MSMDALMEETMRITRLLALASAALSLSACNETVYGDRGYYGRDYYGGHYDPGYYGRGNYGSSGLYGSSRYRDYDDYRGGHRYDEHYRKRVERPAAPIPRGPYIGGSGRSDLPLDKIPDRNPAPSPDPSGGNLTH